MGSTDLGGRGGVNRILVIGWTELRTFFLSPAGWIVPALFYLGSGMVFMQAVFQAGQPATLRAAFGFNAIFILLSAPAIVMGRFCEERRRGTLALLQSSPASTGEIVFGTWLGAMGVLCVLLIPTILQVVLLEMYGRPDLGSVASGFMGLMFIGGAVLASGLVVSALVASQAVAYLVTCLGWILMAVTLEIALPRVVGPQWRGLLAELDPLQRLQDFTVGLVDSSNIVYFAVGTIVLLVMAAVRLRIRRSNGASLAGVMGLLVLLIGVNAVALAPDVRMTFDATKTRAYSLSPRTESLLANLEDSWRVTILLEEERADPAMVRQIDEVLHRFESASSAISVTRLDPTDAQDVIAWEQVLADLRRIDEVEATVWRRAIQDGLGALDSLITFSQVAAGPVRSMQGGNETLKAGSSALAVMASQGRRIVDDVEAAIRVGPDHPLPDWNAAKVILQRVLSQWALECGSIASLLEGRDSTLPAVCRSTGFAAQASRLANRAEELALLPPLPSGNLGVHLLEGEAAVVIGPEGGRIISVDQLLPSAFTETATGAVAFDQRFRGEQLIAAAIRSLADARQPRVVFVHDETGSVLKGGQPDTDVAGVASMLRAGGFVVQEWRPSVDAEKPTWSEGPTAWVVLPPIRGGGTRISPGESALLRATQGLLASPEGVLISLFPSVAPSNGQRDPWAGLVSTLGIDAGTGGTFLRDRSMGELRAAPEQSMELTDFRVDHPVAAALHGQSLLLPLAIPLRITGKDPTVLGEVSPASDLWIASDWRSLVSADARLRRRIPEFDPDTAVTQPVPVLTAVSQPNGSRALVVGSGSWMRTSIADAAARAGGNRVALVHPGNHELMLAGAAWLAGLDDRIARGSLSQEVARLGGITPATRSLWGWILIAGLPLMSLAIGLSTWIRRRY